MSNGYQHQAYPSWRYHESGATCLVSTPEDDAKLGPGWADSPAAFTKPAEAQPAAEPTSGATTTPIVAADALPQAMADELYGASVDALADKLAECQDVALLEKIRAAELANPKRAGGRKGVLALLDGRLKELGA